MLPRKLHLEEVNRFHDMFTTIDELIEVEEDKDKKLELYMKYYDLTKLWNEIDNFIELRVKQRLDAIQR